MLDEFNILPQYQLEGKGNVRGCTGIVKGRLVMENSRRAKFCKVVIVPFGAVPVLSLQ